MEKLFAYWAATIIDQDWLAMTACSG